MIYFIGLICGRWLSALLCFTFVNSLNKLSIKSYITLCFNKPDESVFWSNNNVLKAESTLNVSDQLVFAVVWNWKWKNSEWKCVCVCVAGDKLWCFIFENHPTLLLIWPRKIPTCHDECDKRWLQHPNARVRVSSIPGRLHPRLACGFAG